MAKMTAANANKRYYYTPHNGKRVDQHPITEFDSTIKKHDTEVSPEHFDLVVEAMGNVVARGTGTMARIDSIAVCGKTGTVQNPHGDDHSTFIAFAPKDNPQIALSVYVENGVWGSRWAAPIAGLMVEKYLTDTISSNRKWIEERMLKGNLIPNSAEEDER
jgi:penicillin-binding protein 2